MTIERGIFVSVLEVKPYFSEISAEARVLSQSR